jgi:hypothetical protein
MTERRPKVTRVKSLKRGSALIAARGTGATALTGAISTASPLASAVARAMPTTAFTPPVW